jgi:hypothetical protein
VLTERQIRASRFTWSFIIAANEGDERQQQLFAAGQAAVAELRGNPALATSYTILDEVSHLVALWELSFRSTDAVLLCCRSM